MNTPSRDFDARHFVALRIELPPGWAEVLEPTPDDTEWFSWTRPADGVQLLGRGAAWVVEEHGPTRFQACAARARGVFEDLLVIGDPGPSAAGPLLLGGFGFRDQPEPSSHWSEYPPARLILPEFLVAQLEGRAYLTVIQPRTEDATLPEALDRLRAEFSVPPMASPKSPRPADPAAHEILTEHGHTHFCKRVANALQQIAGGELEKVVVARSLRIRSARDFAPVPLLDRLSRTHPTCTTFAVARRGSVFLGASPERLVDVRGNRVQTSALAGSARRGSDPTEDERIGRALCESKKDQTEHAVVVRVLREALTPFCSTLEVPEAPRLLRFEGIQHLETPLVGTLKNGTSVLELAGRLHPAPSVGGAPRAAALEWLEHEEELERGWYAGAVGWVDASGCGEFCVALRSGLVTGGEARLFAGAGVVEGSDPDAELRETDLKMRALLTPMLEA
ncbi:isochorismate synthase [Myxococcota bacterium]|nr:isochorismate synthase [Myxococcota bacterium]